MRCSQPVTCRVADRAAELLEKPIEDELKVSALMPSAMIVDDDEGIRCMLSAYLQRKGYAVTTAIHGEDALARMPEARPDMVIADICMPFMDGFELFRNLERDYPNVKRILMTGYDIDSYIEMIRQHNIGNVLAKGDDFDIEEWGRYIDSILTGDVFGLNKLLPTLSPQTHLICSNNLASEVCKQIVSNYQGRDRMLFEIALNELIRNAIYHGVLGMTNEAREKWQEDFWLPPEEAVKVSWACDGECMGVAVEDPRGKLRKMDVLRWLDHPIDEQPENDYEHGRGLMLIRRIIDRFVVNIDRGRRTECIILQRFDRARRTTQKSLLIHEV